MLESEIKVIQEAKKELLDEGFVIIGIFGSEARGEAKPNSDVDILYRLDTRKFLSKYGGFRAYSRIDEIKELLKSRLHKDVDLADADALNEIGKKYILKDLVTI